MSLQKTIKQNSHYIHIRGTSIFSSDPFKPQRDRHPLVRGGGRGEEPESKFSVKYPGTLLVMFKDSEL